jgi:hypothetical protein
MGIMRDGVDTCTHRVFRFEDQCTLALLLSLTGTLVPQDPMYAAVPQASFILD